MHQVSFTDLPFDVIAEIARCSMDSFRLMAQLHREFGLWTIGKKCINCFKTVDDRGDTYLDDKLHSFDDKPATQTSYSARWMRHGLRHRDGDKPAYITHSNGGYTASWWKYDTRHRDNGPTEMQSCGYIQYWQNGVWLSIDISDHDRQMMVLQVCELVIAELRDLRQCP